MGRFILRLGFVALVLEILVPVLSVLLAGAAGLVAGRESWASFYLTRLLVAYLVPAVIATPVILGFQNNPELSVFYGVIGGLVVYAQVASMFYSTRKRFAAARDREGLARTRYDSLFVIGAIALYCVMLWVHPLAVNPATWSVMCLVLWLSQVPVLGVLISIFGLFLIASLLFKGALFVVALSGACSNKGSPEKGK
ncbi:MAG: hypothetical protein PHT49_07400 [Desulfovibrionales bacterium]|nr:hypothetical protein [Desulfovibrionales bacterium]